VELAPAISSSVMATSLVPALARALRAVRGYELGFNEESKGDTYPETAEPAPAPK